MTNSVATVSPNVVKSTSSTAAAAMLTDQTPDIPIFLRKTYHMIDTCDQSVACWSEDGETFVVKDPEKFEKQIIPQFFKHSKFSSFVRQLNFYAFRKIKYADTIRIDPKLEAETANYWRFRHEKFQRGKPELLGEIKRMNGQKQLVKKETTTDASGAAASSSVSSPSASTSSAPQQIVVQQENSQLKSEVSNLKQRIEAMTKNIDELTSMVQKVTLATRVPEEDSMNINKKRTKLVEVDKVLEDEEEEGTMMTPDESFSAPHAVAATPEGSPTSIINSSNTAMELDAFPLPPSMPSPMPVVDRTSTSSTELSDEGFVDQLFTAFKTEDFVEFDEGETLPDAPFSQESNINSNRPRPELMNRLSDALSALPREIQELIVDRLIQAITSPKDIQESIAHAQSSSSKNNKEEKQEKGELVQVAPTKDPKQIANLQLAAATLAALLSQCGGESNLKDSHAKALLIPVHA